MLSVACFVALPMRLMVPVLLTADAIRFVVALSELLPIWMKPLLVSVPVIGRVVPPCPPLSSTCSSPETDKFPLGR